MRFTPTDVTSTYAAIAALNANFDDVATLLEKCVMTDGTSPNAMLANLDLNHFKIQNVAVGTNDNDAVNVAQANAIAASAAASLVSVPSITHLAPLDLTIRQAYNPGSMSSWTSSPNYNYEGFSVDLGNYGPRQFGTVGLPTAINGSLNIPATSTLVDHGMGLSGYVKNASTITGGVAIYGEANRAADSALTWGLNTRTQDAGHGGLNVWGYEMDMNIDNISTTAIGIESIGGSSVEPSLSIAFQVSPIGVFTSPKKRWQYGFRSVPGSAVVGIELGPQLEANSSQAQIFQQKFRNSSGTDVVGFSSQVDSSGNAVLTGGSASTLFTIQTQGASSAGLKLLGNNVGFYGATPVAKPTVSGSRGGNAALASLLTALATMGLITDSTSA